MNGACASAMERYFASRTTPTTSSGRPSSAPPSVCQNRCPTADCSGHAMRAKVSFTIATIGRPSRSSAEKARPCTIGISSVVK